MQINQCYACDHCNASRTNSLGQMRCARFHTYVDAMHGCDCFCSSKSNQECMEILKDLVPSEEERNEGN
jgi:hypothetical protein